MSTSMDLIEAAPAIGRLRIAVGFVQGIIAWRLLRLVAPIGYQVPALNRPHEAYWSGQHPMLFAALALLTAYIPVIAIAELGRMRRRMLSIYIGVSAAILSGLAAYDIWRDPMEPFMSEALRVWPSFHLVFCAALGLFIANQLLEHRQRGHALFTHYAEHFDDAWMRGFQIAVALIFSLIFWGVLELGAALFDLIHISWFRLMIDHNWFRCPAIAMAFAAAVQLTDVRPALLRGMRNVSLTLLSWLLPLVVALGLAFLIALLFVGLQPLWATHHAASILLWASALTVFFLNAAYKDGDPSTLPPGVLRWAGRGAGPAVLLLSAIAAYAIALRVHELGWTPERVNSCVVAVIAMVYGAGYTYATTYRLQWLKPMEAVNVFASLVIVGILLLLLTPVADPARLSVNSQLSRLASAEVPPDKFDYQFLRFNSGQYGRTALATLLTSASDDVRSRAARIQAAKSRQFMVNDATSPALTEPAFSHAKVYPAGAQLPDDFKATNWSAEAGLNIDCLKNGGSCDIYVLPYGANAEVAVIVRPVGSTGSPSVPSYPGESARLYQRDSSGRWANTGGFDHMNCPNVVTALQNGQLSSARPEHDDLMVDGVRLRFSVGWRGNQTCAPSRPSNGQTKTRDPDAPAYMGPGFGRPGGL